jgi:histidine triad (HIT) family protein
MYNHEPDGYSCPFCRRTSLDMGLGSGIQHSDIVFDNGTVAAFLAAIQRNPNDGSVLVIPNNHYENIYDMPVDLLAQIHELSRSIAIAQKKIMPVTASRSGSTMNLLAARMSGITIST